MNRLLLLLFFFCLILQSIHCQLIYPQDEKARCAIAVSSDPSPKNKTIVQTETNSTMFPRYDQMLNLRIIGGACVTKGEVTEAYLKLIYIYSCIFPLMRDKKIKDLTSETALQLSDISTLDHIMQREGRTYLHRREENDPELIRRKIDDFIKQLIQRNEYKQYRLYNTET